MKLGTSGASAKASNNSPKLPASSTSGASPRASSSCPKPLARGTSGVSARGWSSSRKPRGGFAGEASPTDWQGPGRGVLRALEASAQGGRKRAAPREPGCWAQHRPERWAVWGEVKALALHLESQALVGAQVFRSLSEGLLDVLRPAAPGRESREALDRQERRGNSQLSERTPRICAGRQPDGDADELAACRCSPNRLETEGIASDRGEERPQRLVPPFGVRERSSAKLERHLITR